MKSTQLLLAALIFMLFSCTQESSNIIEEVKLRDFYAVVQTNATRVSLQGKQNGVIVWNQDDYVTIFAGTVEPLKYKVKEGCHGSSETTLTPCDAYSVMSEQAGNASLESFYYNKIYDNISANVAFYPFDCVNSCNEENGSFILDVTIPVDQCDALSTFGKNLLPIVAVTKNGDDDNLLFKNIMGLLRLTISGDIAIDGIKVYGNNMEKLSGSAYVTTSNNDLPSIKFKETASEYVNLVFNDKLQLEKDSSKDIFIVLPPQEYKKGITIEYIIGHSSYKKVISYPFVLHRSEIFPVSQELTKAEIIKDVAVPAICWIDDDFTGVTSTGSISSAYQTMHDICLDKGWTLDYAIQSRLADTETYLPSGRIEVMKQWYSEGFRFLYHPTHSQGWYNYDANHPHDASLIETCILNTERAFGWYGIEVPKLLVWPGNSSSYDDNYPIVKKYFECAFTATFKGSNHLADNDKYQLRRLSFQNLGRYMTKTELKEYIRTAVENNDWIVFSSHLHSIDESMVPDENTYNIANVVELLEYANSLCQLKHTVDIWNSRKILWELR